MTASLLLAKTGEGAKAGPIGLVVILVLCIACYFLFKSMSKHMRKVREEFPGQERAEQPQPESPGSASPQSTVPQSTVPQSTVPQSAVPPSESATAPPAQPDEPRP